MRNLLDMRTFGMVGLTSIAITGAACFLPARRALKIDPVQALRGR
jgi:ABC-type antimicrobial peptide transport system permease subunit